MTPSIARIRECLLTANGPRYRADFLRLMPDGGTLRRAIASLKAAGECHTAPDPYKPQHVVYFFSAEERDAWLAEVRQGGAD